MIFEVLIYAGFLPSHPSPLGTKINSTLQSPFCASHSYSDCSLLGYLVYNAVF